MSSKNSTEDKLKRSGIRPTKARCSIIEYLCESGIHPTTEQLKEALSVRGTDIPAATLYQNLEKLTSTGLLNKFPGPSGETRYDANLSHHHHLICTVCGKVIDIRINTPLTEFEIIDDNSGTQLKGWKIENAAIEFKGMCPNCLNKP